MRPIRSALAVSVAAALLTTACATSSSTSSSDGPSTSDPLKLGWLLPQTGPIASLGPPQIAALELAQKDINAAGGILGRNVEFVGGDEAGDPTVAGQAVDRLLTQKVPAIIGAGSSSISLSVIGKISGADVVQCSGMNTSPQLTDYPDNGFYFRTVPSDKLQGAVMGNLMAKDGAKKVAILARSDAYATGLADTTEATLKSLGVQVVQRVNYDPSAQNLTGEVRKVTGAKPDAIVMFSFEEGAKILQGLVQAGAGPDKVKLYGTDALPIGDLPKLVNPGNAAVLQGMTLTQASSGENSPFTKRLQEFKAGLSTTAFSPYFYDCAMLVGLAAESAKSVDPTKIRDAMVEATKGGTECQDYATCKALAEDGKDFAYVGAAGPLRFTDKGEPSTGMYDVLQYDASGKTKTLTTVRQDAS
jgi:ABC-type branched-subunit amino acid transport system substrate-binding protein